MMKHILWGCSLMLLMAGLVSSQSCPPNTAMGLCEAVPKPCFGDNDCFNGEICCPQACSRSCKPRSVGRVSGDASVPDLLNDPRVFVGKCPQANCYTLFGGESDECSTSNLCPGGQYCCNDGCRNVCQLTPEFAARIAQEENRAKKQQQLVIQKQQDEMRRRHQEMFVQRQRQIATAERARQQAEARAAAEAELAAAQARTKYEAGLRAVAQTNAVAALQQRMAHRQIQQQKPAQGLTSSLQSSGSAGSFLDNFVGEPQIINNVNTGNNNPDQQYQQQTTPAVVNDARGYFNANKRENMAGSLVNQINSPANANPYNLVPQQNVNGKDGNSELLSLIHSATSSSDSQSLARGNKALSRYPAEASPASYGIYERSRSFPPPPQYRSQKASLNYPTQSISSAYPSARQLGQSPYSDQPGQGPVDPFLMYQAMQTAA